MKNKIYYLTLVLVLFLSACKKDDDKKLNSQVPAISGLEAEYNIPANKVLELKPVLTNNEEAVCEWWLDGEKVATSFTYTFTTSAEEGEHSLILKVTNDKGSTSFEIKIQVIFSPFIANVFDYLPAPGQFVNELPKYNQGDTHQDMVKKVEGHLAKEKSEMITLGGWGGYVTFGFDHTIKNVEGKCDFRIDGNTFVAKNLNNGVTCFGGSCEPGIIMVAYDKNKNKRPDAEEWYEIKGSGSFTAENEPWYQTAYDKKNASNKGDMKTFRDYEMTYDRPTLDTDAVIEEYIHWKDNKGNKGYKFKNKWHKQSYYPLWVNKDQITYKGIRLADNGIDEGANDTTHYFILYAYKYGYVDNYPNDDDRSAIDIDWAIDKAGNKANLPGIDFVKVINGVNKENGWLGEASTEVAGAKDLHMLGIDINSKTD